MTEMKLTRAEIKAKILEDTGKEVKEAVKDATKQQNLALRSMLADEQAYREKTVAEKVDPIGGLIIALAANKGVPSEAAKWASRKYGEKSKITKALNTTTDTAGGFLVPEVMSPEVIELLSATTIMRKMGCRVMQLVNGQLTIPKMTGGATAAYISEGDSIRSSQPTFGQINLQGHKLAAQVPISNDLLKFATANADQIVRQDLVNRMALREDLAFMEGTGALATPVGLRNQMLAANVLTMTATPTAVTATTDAGRMISALDNANIPDVKRGWIMRPSAKNYLSTVREATGALAFPEAQKGVFWGYPIATTTAISIDAVGPPTQSVMYLVEFSECIIGDAMTLRIDASDTAAYTDSGLNVVSAFSRDETVIRAISMHDFGMRHDGAAVALTGTTWGGA